jgi:NAD(P)-dependent dehydrogenase (short-subunit alcohol dehydrogenase family)
VRFDRFIYLNQRVEAHLDQQGPGGLLISLTVDGAKVASVRADFDVPDVSGPAFPLAGGDGVDLREPRALDLPDLAGDEGCVPLAATDVALAEAFPALAASVGARTVGGLLALSTLVGMHAPGLHSIFSKFTAMISAQPDTRALRYRVAKIQSMLRAIEIEVSGAGVSGVVSCFLRRPPVSQPSAAALLETSLPDCAGDRILIVGGSRGLGEVTAKLCALGGGEVTITYAVGAADAEAVRADILSAGGLCEVRRFDVTEPVFPQLGETSAPFTHVYYFATTHIFRQKAQTFSASQLSQFLDVHVHGFHAVCEALAGENREMRVFYPSSVAVEERPADAVEYVIAKSAGEILSQALSSVTPGLTVVTERLPRADTDQTATVLPVRSATAVDVMRPIVQRMHGRD